MHYYVVDSFTDHVFGGGEAGVVITDDWLSEEMMQSWFMPEGEINLNSHATLAAAWCIFKY